MFPDSSNVSHTGPTLLAPFSLSLSLRSQRRGGIPLPFSSPCSSQWHTQTSTHTVLDEHQTMKRNILKPECDPCCRLTHRSISLSAHPCLLLPLLSRNDSCEVECVFLSPICFPSSSPSLLLLLFLPPHQGGVFYLDASPIWGLRSCSLSLSLSIFLSGSQFANLVSKDIGG